MQTLFPVAAEIKAKIADRLEVCRLTLQSGECRGFAYLQVGIMGNRIVYDVRLTS